MTINAVDRPPDIPVGKKPKRNIDQEKKIVSQIGKTLKENLTFDQSKRSPDVFDQYKEKYTFDNQELDYGAIAEDQVSELPAIPIDKQQYIKDETLGQGQFKDQPLDTTRITQEAWWNMDSYTAEFPSKNTNSSWNWRQESFFDSSEWENLSKGFMNENLVGMLYSAAFDYDKKHPIDPNYNVFDDETYADIINKNPNYFSKSSSQQETQYLVNEFYSDLKKYNRPYWQMFGTVLGGFTDISSVFFFSKLAKPLFASTRMNRLKKTTAILGAEELVKQSVDQDRPNIYGAYILGANAIMQLMLPAFKGGYTLEQKNHIKNLVLHADLQDEIGIIQKNKHKKVKIKYVNDTGVYKQKNGVIFVNKKGEAIHPSWQQQSVTVLLTKNGYVIKVNQGLLNSQFANKVWTKGKTPLPKNQFKSVDEWMEYQIKIEQTRKYMPRKTGETLIDYQKRIQVKAMSAPILPQSAYKGQEYLNNKLIYLEELEMEQFVPTWLNKLGERSDWNPIQRAVNRGNITAMRFVQTFIKSPLLKIGNTMGIATPASLEQWMKLDMYHLGTAMEEVSTLYSKYKKSLTVTGGKAISRKEFHARISKGIVNPSYKDSIPEIITATKQIKSYYKTIGKKIKESNPALNTQEILVSSLESALKKLTGNTYTRKITYQDGTKKSKILSREQLIKIIKEERAYLEQIKKNPLRENYLNRVVNREKIEANIPAWRKFAAESLKRTHPELSDEHIMVIVKSYENKKAWTQFNKNKIGQKHEDLIIDEYLFSPTGMSGNLKKRKLKINQEEWMEAGYFHSDALFLMQMYHKSVLPDVYITSVFGSPNAMGGAWFRGKGYQAGLKELEYEYNVKIQRASSKAEKEKLYKERDSAIKDAEAVRDLFKGTYGVSNDPSSAYSKGISMLKLFNAMTSLQGASASIVDLGRSVFYNGLSKSLKTTWESFNSKMTRQIYAMTKKEGRLSGELFEMQLNTRAMIFNDISQLYDTGSKIHAGMQKMSGAFFMVNLMSPFNQMIKTHQTLMVTSRILEECENWVKGVISPKNEARLAQSGIDLNDAKAIISEYTEHGMGAGSKNVNDLKHSRLANSHEWIEQKIAKKFNLAVQNEVNIGIITPALGDTPLWMSTQLGGVLAQFKKFSMGMTQRMLVRGFQEKDANFFGNIIMMVALGAVIDMMRTRAFDGDYSKKPFINKINDAFERSGVGGIFMDVNNAGQRLLMDDMGGKLGAITGPSGSQVDKILGIATADASDEMASNVRRLIPFQNIWYLDSLFDRIEQGIQ